METDYINLWKSIDLCSFRGAEIRDILIDNPIFSLPFAVQPLSCWSYFHVRILFLTCFFFFYFFFPWKFSYQWQNILKQFSGYFPGIQILKMKLLILQKDADEVVDSAGGCRLFLKSPSRQGALHSHRHPAACQSLLTGASIKSKYEFTFMLIDSFISVANGEEKEFTFQCKYERFWMLPCGTKWWQVVSPIYFWAWPWQDTCFHQNW